MSLQPNTVDESLKSNRIIIKNVENLVYNIYTDANNRRHNNLTTDEEKYKYILRYILDIRDRHHHSSERIFNHIHSLTKMECKEEEKADHFINDTAFGLLNTLLMSFISEDMTDLSFDEIDLIKQCKKINGEKIDIGINAIELIHINSAIKIYNEIIKQINVPYYRSFESNGIDKLTMKVFKASIIRTITTVLDENLKYDNIKTYKCMHIIFRFMKYLINNNIDLEE
eukprot:188961_1